MAHELLSCLNLKIENGHSLSTANWLKFIEIDGIVKDIKHFNNDMKKWRIIVSILRNL